MGLFGRSRRNADEDGDWEEDNGKVETLPADYVGSAQYYRDEEKERQEEWWRANELGIDIDEDD